MHTTHLARFTYCLCGDQVIFLDVCSDRYFTLPTPLNTEFRQILMEGTGTSEAGSTLVARLLDNSEPCRPITSPTGSAALAPQVRINAMCIGRTLLAYVSSVIRLKRRGLADVLRRSANRRPLRLRATSSQTYDCLAAAFNRLAPICGSAENCLPRSIAFHALALAAGHAPSLVIGVKRDPFAAHCWVQDGASVLNDSAEHVRIFTPILII